MTVLLVNDVSEYQGPRYDFRAQAAAGVRGVYVKAYEGNSHANPYFDEQVEAVRDAGMEAGAYHFLYPLPDAPGHVNRDPLGQANLFYQSTAKAREAKLLTMPPMGDAEWPGRAAWGEWGCTGPQLAQWLKEFCAHVDAMWLRTCGVYCDPDWMGQLPPSELGASSYPGLAQRPLWAAEYPVGGPLKVPPGGVMAPIIKPWSRATIWQYTDKFTVPGCSPCDGGVFLGDEDDWSVFLGG